MLVLLGSFILWQRAILSATWSIKRKTPFKVCAPLHSTHLTNMRQTLLPSCNHRICQCFIHRSHTFVHFPWVAWRHFFPHACSKLHTLMPAGIVQCKKGGRQLFDNKNRQFYLFIFKIGQSPCYLNSSTVIKINIACQCLIISTEWHQIYL